MMLPEMPSGSIATLSDEELLRLFSAFGHCSKIAMRKALALLPEIVKRGLYRRAGFASYYEFARQKAGAAGGVVDKVLRLHEKIGHMPELWGLLACGDEGWSKLAVVQPIATVDNAASLASLVRRCSKSELEEYVRRVRDQQRDERPGQLPLAGKTAGGPGGTAKERVPVAFASSGSAACAALPTAPASGGDPGARLLGDQVAASRARAAASSPASQEPVGASESPGPAAQGVPEPPASPTGKGPGLPGIIPAEPDRAEPRLRGVTLHLRPDDEALLRAYQEQYRRQRGEAISLGEVVGLLLRSHWPGRPLAHLPAVAGPAAGEPGPDARADARGAAAGTGDREGSRSHGDSGDLAGSTPPADSGSGSPEASGDATFRDASGAAEGQVAEPGSRAAATANLTAGPGQIAQMAARRTVEVVVRVAELGKAWIRGFTGFLPAGIADTFKSHEAIVLGDLYVLAVQAAARCRTDRVPAAVRKFVALRTGFRCGVQGCGRPIHDLHHKKALSEGGTHHPDNIEVACRLHHRMEHKDLFADLAAGVPIRPGDPDRSTAADMAFQSICERVAAAPS